MTRLTFTPGNHAYRLVDPVSGRKERVPSVTTLLGQLGKPQLVNWAARTAAEFAVDNWDTLTLDTPPERRKAIAAAHDRARNKAAAKGTTLHSMAEGLLSGAAVEVPDVLVPQVEGLAKFWERSGWTRVAAEAMVWSDVDEDLGLCAYAGTLDLIVDHPAWGRGLVDIKTGTGVWPEMAVQVEAYARAAHLVVDDEDGDMPDIAWTGVLHVREETTLHTVPPPARKLAADRFDVLRMLRVIDSPWLDEVVS